MSCPQKEATAMAVHASYHARHPLWQGPLTLLENGMFVGGSYKPNGYWKVENDSEELTLLWHSWPQETLRRTPSGGYSTKDLVLEKVAVKSNGYEAHRFLNLAPISERGLYSYSTSGMCDRITNILLFQSMAAKFGRRLHWGWPLSGECNCSFHKLFECSGVEVQDCHTPLGIQVTERYRGGSVDDLSNLLARHDKKPWIFVEQGYYGHNFDDFDLILRPAPEVASLVEGFKDRHWRSEMIGVHVRRGDKSSFAPEISRYFEATDSAVNICPDAGIFLCSDDAQCENEFRMRYGGKVATYPTRTFHRDIEEGIIDALVGLYLLRHTSGVIGSSMSGFSLCAGWNCGFLDIPSTFKNWPRSGETWELPQPKFKS